MKSFLDTRLEHLGETGPVELIVHLGAGSTQALPGYLATGATHVVVCEADPEHAAATSRAARSETGGTEIKVLNLGVSDSCGPATLHRLTFDQFSSWRAVTGLKELFPGLRTTGSIAVDLVDVNGLLDHFGFPRGANAALILFEHGEAGGILDQLIAAGQLTGFSDIFLTLPGLALFENGLDGAALQARLEGQGYRLVAQDQSDPDLPQAHFRLDLSAQQIAVLYTELEQAESRIAEARDTVEALNTDKANLSARNTALSAELDALRAQIETERQEAQSATKARDALRMEAESKVEALNIDKSNLQARNAALGTEIGTLREQVGSLKSNIEDLQGELLRARGQRELREADLRDLQSQYRQLFETRQAQDVLLANLARDLEQTIALLEQGKPAKRPAARKTTRTAGTDGKKPATTRKTAAKAAPKSTAKSTPKPPAKSARTRGTS